MKKPPPKTLQWAYAWDPMGVLGGWTFFEVPQYPAVAYQKGLLKWHLVHTIQPCLLDTFKLVLSDRAFTQIALNLNHRPSEKLNSGVPRS